MPRIVHATDKAPDAAFAAMVAQKAPGWTLRFADDAAARATILEHCGVDVALAFDCLLPGAFRADIYRHCALYAFGGVYMDQVRAPPSLSERETRSLPPSIAVSDRSAREASPRGSGLPAAAADRACLRPAVRQRLAHARHVQGERSPQALPPPPCPSPRSY